MIVAKFQFESEAEFLEKVASLIIPGQEITNNPLVGIDSTLVKVVIEEQAPTYDNNGEIVTPGIISDKFHVDILFGDSYGNATDELPAELAPYEVFPEPSGEHSFLSQEHLYVERFNARNVA